MVKSTRKKPTGLLGRLKENWSTVATFVIIYLFILQFFGTYMLTKTTTTGGDLGSHWVLAQYLRDYLVPTGRLVGWYPHWMGGLPLFQYYFVPPYFLMVLLGPLISLEVAFKLVSAAWIFFTPIAFYYGAKALGFEKPGPEIAATLSLCLTWLETVTGGNYAQWGGNVKSAMAGQFTYGISLAFFALCLGLLWKAYHTRKHLILTSVVFSMVVLHHLYPTIALGLASTYFLWHAIKHKKFENAVHLGKIFLLGFMIAGFWLIPSYAKLNWSSPPRDVFYGLPSMDWVFIQEYTLFFIIIILGASVSLIQYFRKNNSLLNSLLFCGGQLVASFLTIHFFNAIFFKHNSISFYLGFIGILMTLQAAALIKESRLLFCVYTFFLIFIQIYLSMVLNLLYARFIPMVFVVYLLLTTRSLMTLTRWFKAKALVPIIIALLVVMWMGVGVDGVPYIGPMFKKTWYVSHGIKDAPDWLKWNYAGIEVKKSWPALKQLYNYTANLPLTGRINYEYYDYGQLGTARIFEQSPAFTNRSVMESLLVESSTTFPFFYYMQKTVSETSWWPGFPIKIPTEINLKHGKDIFWVYNVQYYIIYSKTIKELIKNETDFHYLKTIGDADAGYFEIYSVNEDSHYADIAPREPILVVTDYWRPFSFKWFDVTDLDVPVAYKSTVDDYDLDHFNIIVVNKTIDFEKRPGTRVFDFNHFLDAVNASRPLDTNCRLSEDYLGELLTVNTSCAGKPLWIKIPYFPNWKTYDAKRIYYVSPNLMLVFPETESFTLYYAWLPSDVMGYLVSIIALVIVIYPLLLHNSVFTERFHKPLLASMRSSKRLKLLLSLPSKAEGALITLLEDGVVVVNKNKWTIIMVFALLWVGMSTTKYNSRVSLCSVDCMSKGYEDYKIPPFGNVIDNYDMGANNEGQNIIRDLKCTAVCDPSRKDFVYVSGGGYVEFTMYVKPMEENTLSIYAIDNQNCRQNDVYVDGKYLGQMYGIGEIGQRANFDFRLPKMNKSVIRVRIYHNASKTDCYGFDVFTNQIRIPECLCLSEPSAAQQREYLLMNIIGVLAVGAAAIVIAYNLAALNKTLKNSVRDPLQSAIRKTVVYAIHVKFTTKARSAAAKIRLLMTENKKLAVLVVIAIIGSYFIFQYASRYLERQSICTIECRDKGFTKGYAPSQTVVDEFNLGADNAGEYPEHNFVCNAVCDELRRNYVYASGGQYIEFDMAVEPEAKNVLSIKAGNFNELCRQNDVYINGVYVGEMSQPEGELPEGEYDFEIPHTTAEKIKVRIDHNISKTSCWGNDIFTVRTKLPRCVCE